MAIIDMQCHFGALPASLTVRPPELATAGQYADQYNVETLCFTAPEAATDIDGGNARLDAALQTDARFRGWLTLSVHQPAESLDLARQYLTKTRWAGARFEQASNADAVTSAGGHEIINGLRRYLRPVLLTVTSPETLQAAITVAQEFRNLRFIIAPQSDRLTSNAVPAIKEILNLSLLPTAAFTERDIVAQAVAIIGERRVVWGSDWGRFHPAAAVGMIRDSVLTGPQRERIVYRNARELLPQ